MNPHAVEHCDTMDDVRRHIDALDARIVPLLVERGGYVAQAARIKPHQDQVYDQPRIDFIVERVKSLARDLQGSEAVVEATYRAMIDAFIAYEHGEFARLRRED
ncbi:chorismate mutase [Hydrogenophaga sp.]|uniref:chorismate mutase n=1 Tax=Hydrogenophaga sp. TaxID=1904254 RepID=UPI003562AA67